MRYVIKSACADRAYGDLYWTGCGWSRKIDEAKKFTDAAAEGMADHIRRTPELLPRIYNLNKWGKPRQYEIVTCPVNNGTTEENDNGK